ncbi:CS1 type fimbrial major subunit [Rosenbergiella epipactidis]|uniref:CS1 type fimbrial major subunit n=1 Tax=Rosenbergiella epipactidis TaxID=1544694 RepID=UPI001F4F6B0C|nr:CS1 type fimbrial major subunit [Rosenbergiella epipactidis]
MKNKLKVFSIASLLAVACSSNAVERTITVNADIDSTVDLTLSSGDPLPPSIDMQYLPGKGLSDNSLHVKLWTNSADKDLIVQLATPVILRQKDGTGTIPLKVTLNGTELSPSETTLTYATIFPNGSANGSAILPLTFSQATPGPITTAGKYSGMADILITQSTK